MIDEEDRSSIFLISFHYLLHVVESIEDFGPCRGYWQFPMERMCGMLIPLVKSQVHPYANLWNNLVLNERFNHLKYMTKFYEHIFPSKEEKQWPSHRVFTTSLYQEFELYSPSKKYFIYYRINKIKRNLFCHFRRKHRNNAGKEFYKCLCSVILINLIFKF